MKQLRPLILKEAFYTPIEDHINDFFLKKFYEPILDIIKKYMDIKLNSTNAIADAIMQNRIQYIDGVFSGKFNATISSELQKLGGVFNLKTKTWRVPKDKLPYEIKYVISRSEIEIKKMNDEIGNFINTFSFDKVADDFSPNNGFVQAITKIDTDWRKTAAQLEVTPDMTDEARENIASDYSENLKLDIKKWSDENILKLREQVQENANKGLRSESFSKIIQDNYKTSKSKAKFLARQETSLLMSKYREERYKAAGIKKYRWVVTHDARLRDDHADLDGEIFSWDEPPIIDTKTGRRGHPGEDYNCRCLAVPVLD